MTTIRAALRGLGLGCVAGPVVGFVFGLFPALFYLLFGPSPRKPGEGGIVLAVVILPIGMFFIGMLVGAPTGIVASRAKTSQSALLCVVPLSFLAGAVLGFMPGQSLGGAVLVGAMTTVTAAIVLAVLFPKERLKGLP